MMQKIITSFFIFISFNIIFADNKYSVIEYTSSTAEPVAPCKLSGFDGILVSNTYENGKGQMVFKPNNGDHLTMIGDSAFVDCNNITSMVIPEGVTRIGYRAFAPTRKLYSVKLPSTLDSLDQRALHGAHLLDVDIPEGIRTLSFFCFGYSWLTYAKVPNTVTIVENSAFECSYYLESVDLPAGITSFGYAVFANCPSLRSINFAGTKEQWNNIKKHSHWYCGRWQPTPLEVIHCSDGDIDIEPWYKTNFYVAPDEDPKTYDIEITDCGWTTVCLPITTKDIPKNLSVYTVLGFENLEKNTLILKQTDKILAYRPYLIHGEPSTYILRGQCFNIPEFPVYYNGLLYGAIKDSIISDEHNFVLQNKNGITAFYRVDNSHPIVVPMNKAFLFDPKIPGLRAPLRFSSEEETIIDKTYYHFNTVIYDINGNIKTETTPGINIVIKNDGQPIKTLYKK